MFDSQKKWFNKLPLVGFGILFGSSTLASPSFIQAATWNLNGDGSWNVNANWTPPTFPNAIDAEAAFANPGSPIAITLGQNITVGTLNFQNTTGLGYTIEGSNPLNFQVSSGTSVINTSAGTSNTISSRVILNNPLIFNLDGSDTFTISGKISGTGPLIQGSGATLFLQNTANTYLSGNQIFNGTLKIQADGSLGNASNTVILESNGSTLEFASDLSLASTRTLTLNSNGFIQVNGGTSAINSLITGAGSLNKVGIGTLVLGNSNTYVNGTNILQGAVSISADSNLGQTTGEVTFVENGAILEFSAPTTLDINRNIILTASGTLQTDTGTSTINGLVTGAGALNKTGTGALHLANSNDYQGGTNISQGTIQISTDLNLGNTSGGITFMGNGGKLELLNAVTIASTRPITLSSAGTIQADSGTSLYNGTIAGGSSLTIAGPGIFALGGNNTYSGGTSIQSGATLALSGTGKLLAAGSVNVDGTFNISASSINQTIGNLSGSGLVNLGANTLTAGTSDSTTFSGVIQGSGGFIKAGNGALSLTGLQTYTGNTVVSAGTLLVNGDLSSSPLTTVNAGATLGGTGSLYNVSIFGTLSPGNSIGTLTANQFIFQAGSIFDVELIGTSTDEIVALDIVTILPGSTLSVKPLNLQPDSYTIATATNGISGRFSSLSNLFPRYAFDVIYDPNAIILDVTMVDFATFFAPGNLQQIASCFDTLISDSDLPQADSLLEVLNTLSIVEMRRAFNQFDPSLLGSINIAELDTSEGLLDFYTNHISHYRLNAMATCETIADSCGYDAFWIAPFALTDRRGKSSELRAQSGYNNWTYGIATGYDFKLVDDLLMTVGFSYSNSKMEWKIGPHASAMYNSYSGIVGAAYVDPCFSLEACFVGTYHDVRANRKIFVAASPLVPISIDPIDYRIKNHNQAYSLASNLFADYTVFTGPTWKGMFVTMWPYVNLDYLFLHQFKYDEHGGGVLDLQMHERDTDLLIPEIGLGFSLVKETCSFFLYADASIGYSREYRFLGHTLKANFRETPGCDLELTGLFPRIDTVIPRVDVGIQNPCNGFSCFFSYKGACSRSFNSSQISLEFKSQF